MKTYKITAGMLVIADPDYHTETYIDFDGGQYVYTVLGPEGTTIQFGHHGNLSDLETLVGLDKNDIQMIENTFGGK